MMSQNESIMIFNVPTNIQEFLGNDFLNDFHKWRIKNKILLKVIFSKHCARSEIANSYPLTEVKCLENGNESLSAFVVCKDLVSLILSNKPLSIIDIKGKNIADTFKNNFEFFWVHSKKLG
jgi:hypothetical protein